MFDNKIVYKILCNFDGKPRKTKFINYYSSEWCDPLNAKYGKLKTKVINENPEVYVKFRNRQIEKPVFSRVEFSIRVDPNRKAEIINNLRNLLKDFTERYDFESLQELIYNNIDGIISTRLTNNDTLQSNVLVAFIYNVLEANENKFYFISGKAVGTYCAD